MRARVLGTLAAAAVLVWAMPAAAQWLKYPTEGVPRSKDGKVNLNAPAPRTKDGRPDFAGLWLTGNPIPCDPAKGADFLDCGAELPLARDAINIGISLPGGLPYQPWAADLVKKRTADQAKDDPHVRCLPDTFIRSYGLPHMQKFVQVPGLLVMLDEMNAGYRQIFTDGRPLPANPQPAWLGYSVGKWEGDTFVVETIGLNDVTWLDDGGLPHSEALRVTARFTRRDFGHLEIRITIDDSQAYTRPWTVTIPKNFVADDELIEFMCENEKDLPHMVGK